MGKICSKCVSGETENGRPKKPKGHDAIRNNTASPKSNGAIPQSNGVQPDETDIWLAKIQAQMEKQMKKSIDPYYKMDHKNRGLCLILNHETFVDRNLGIRKGTQVDRDRLLKTFTELDFDVRIEDDPTETKIRAILKKVGGMDHTDNDCLVVIVLSHGELVPYYDYSSGDECNTLLSHDLMSYVHSNNTMYPLQHIWSYFTDENCPTLANKPRIFLVQACQGSKTDPGIRLISKRSAETECDSLEEESDTTPFDKMQRTQPFIQRMMSIDETDGVPYEPVKVGPILPQKDFLIAYASLPGYYSFRNTLNAAWFIQSLCRELDDRDEDDDFVRILTFVCQTVAYDFESHSYDKELDLKKQIPCVASMLTKLLVFPKRKNIANGC